MVKRGDSNGLRICRNWALAAKHQLGEEAYNPCRGCWVPSNTTSSVARLLQTLPVVFYFKSKL
jgi:hypothetical protein